jgi:hypothetical protein
LNLHDYQISAFQDIPSSTANGSLIGGASLSPSSLDVSMAEKSGSFAPNISRITWCSQSPPKGSGYYQLDIKDVHAYADILQSLPTGQKTIKGVALPDSTTFILSLQLLWLIITITLRLVSHYRPSLLEIYGLFTLTSYILERVITQFNVPAWQQHVVFTSAESFLPAEDDGARGSWKSLLVIIPILLTASWPVYMILYGLKATKGGPLEFTPAVCIAAGGVHCAGAIWLVISGTCSGSKNGCLRILRWVPLVIAYGAFILSRFIIISLGIYQAFYGEREIFLIPPRNWDIPHLTG